MSKPEIKVDDNLSYYIISKSDPSNWVEVKPDTEWQLKKITTGMEILTIQSIMGKKRMYTLDDKSTLDIKITGLSSVRVTGQVYQVNDS